MDDDQFTKLFTYMQGEFRQLRAEINSLDKKIDQKVDRVYSLLDQDLKRREIDDHERLAISHQADQHGDWIERASAELKIKYNRAG